jgi:DNA-binding NarL/FixJ family response regulator
VAVAGAPRILIAEDHAPTRAMIRRAVEQDGFAVTAEVPDAPGAIRAVRTDPPDLALLDIRMPGGGIHAARVIGDECPEVAVVMLTVSADDDDFFEALSAGASGYLLKGQGPTEVADALRRVLDGEAAIHGTMAKRLLHEYRSRGPSQRFRDRLPGGRRLTPREWEVLQLLDEGLGTSEIGDRLFVADVTVRSHLAAIIRKLGVGDRSGALQALRQARGATGEVADRPDDG